MAPETIYRKLKDGTFNVPAFKAGEAWRFLTEAVEAAERGDVRN